MFCPRCGVDAGDARFCRSCGANLTVVSDVLEGRGPSRLRNAATGGQTNFNVFHSSRLSNERVLDGHTAVSVFGATRIDLTAAPIDAGEMRIRVISVFGGTEIHVAEDVAVRVTGVTMFGGVKVRGREVSNGVFGVNEYETPGYAQASRRLHIDAASIFSEVKIKS